MRAVVLLVLLGMMPSLSAAPAPLPRRDKPAGDLRQLQGDWVLVSERGQTPPMRKLTLSIHADRMRFRMHRKGTEPGEGVVCRFTLNPRTSPRQIDAHFPDHTVLRGVYRLSEDIFVLCCSEEKRDRPTDFKETNEYHLTFQRQGR